jgi:regulator of cell morphogenesis and NO signaling
MSTQTILDPAITVGELVAARPARSRLLEQLGIDYCCGGKKPLASVLSEKGLDANTFMALLSAVESNTQETALADPAKMSTSELISHIVNTHHGYLRQELPRLRFMSAKVADRHGANEPRLETMRTIVESLADDLEKHMGREEYLVFPLLEQLDRGEIDEATFCSIARPMKDLEEEHEQAGVALASLRVLSDGYQPPDWACNTYRAYIDALRELEADMHQHVHKENNVLFPRALKQIGN